MKAKLMYLNIWIQLNLPVLAPILDRFLHPFGICMGH
jgi:hypothetical protein